MYSLAVELFTQLNIFIMKKLALALAVAFTMGLAASSVTASTVNDDKKTEKKECCSKDKKADCSKDKKACDSKDKKAETPAPAAPAK
jgi:hypothetical protein